MANPILTDSDRLTQLEQQLASAIARITALETLTSTSDTAYLQQQLFGAVEGSKQADSLNHFQ